MPTKLSAVLDAMQSDNFELAICLAAKFPRLGAHRVAILDAYTAISNPRWAVAMKRDLAADIAAGRRALVAAYCRPTPAQVTVDR